MVEVPSSPQTGVFQVDHKRRKVTPERAKANYLCGQLRLRLQYAKLKVEHGWQRQNLNEVENLYFRHAHKRRSVATPKQHGHWSAVTNAARYTPNMLFPVNDYPHAQDTSSEEQRTDGTDEFHPDSMTEAGSIAENSSTSGVYSTPPATTTFVSTASSVGSHPSELPRPRSVPDSPDAGTLEQAAASMFGMQPGPSTHGPASSSTGGLAPAPPLPEPKYSFASNGGAPMYYQPMGAPYSSTSSVYPPAQAQFYPPHPYQYEFHYHTPPQGGAFTSHPRQSTPSSQPPSQPHQSPQVQRRQPDSLRAAAPVQQPSPPNPTLTYDAFWSSHSLSAHPYRNTMFNIPGPVYQAQVNGTYSPMNSQLGAVDGTPSMTMPTTVTGLPEMAGAPAHATPPARTS